MCIAKDRNSPKQDMSVLRGDCNSTAYITGPNGEIKNSYQYDAFGNLQNRNITVRNRILYTGQQYDEITGQYYLRARFYHPAVGRFLQEDVYRRDGLNLYAYCANNPVVYYDPSGYAKSQTDNGKCSNNEQINNDRRNKEKEFELPDTVRSAKGIEGKFTESGYTYRIDTNKVAPGEGGFHVHIYRKFKEIAKVTGRGGYVKTHKNRTLLKPSEMNRTVRREINRLVTHVRKKL